MVLKSTRCTVDMLSQKMRIKTQDVGKTSAIRLTRNRALNPLPPFPDSRNPEEFAGIISGN